MCSEFYLDVDDAEIVQTLVNRLIVCCWAVALVVVVIVVYII